MAATFFIIVVGNMTVQHVFLNCLMSFSMVPVTLFKGNLAHNFVPHCLLYFSSNLDIIKPSKVRNLENIGLIRSCGRNTMKFENPPQYGFPNESLCDVIKLAFPLKGIWNSYGGNWI